MRYGLIGERLGHSYSCEIHQKIGDYPYSLQEISKEDLALFLQKREFCAMNVTIPYKKDVIPFLDGIDEKAKSIGAVNTVVNRSGKLYGYNTDFDGLCALISFAGISLKDKKVLILGSGGTSMTALSVAKSQGAREVYRVSRTKKEGVITYDEVFSFHKDCQVIINTTPVGMFPSPEATPLSLSAFPLLEGVLDAIYHPLRTTLVQEAQGLGVKASGGLYMLVAQAVYASALFFGKEPDADAILPIYQATLREKENAVLIGMPSSGKTTVGKLLARGLDRPFVDTDERLTEKLGMPVSLFIEKYGEESFRKEETEVIREVAKMSGCVIATGGGAVLKEENVRLLKQNGKLFFLDRALENLTPTASRPLSSDKARLEALYTVRLPIYQAAKDITVEANRDASLVAKEIKETFFS
ncbi:MAG: shikimate dehydrogenase [Clostridia bacterium]|nr:shikimate dehydrogenase [Clostridia bacterium]